MRRQPSINASMRTILIDWLVEVAEEYSIQTQTLYMAVSFIDRFLSIMSVDRSKLQLLGTAAMFVAAKYEEVYPPDVGEFVYITDDTYSKKQVLRMEYLIVKVLTFDMSGPTTFSFISHISVMCSLPERVMHLALFISELSLLEGDPYLQFLPSVIACSAIALARHCLNYTIIWTDALIQCTGYTLNDLKNCIGHLNSTHSNAFTISHKAIREKYSSDKFHNISSIPHKALIIKDSDELSPTH
ncbi:unnamed protein product [Bemisia tabaci]|uniref:Cyclin A n=2 Tax=Bemisia tabaci TaxID=7038 RepID=A0A9P0APR7_BEMTA|nr:unnamed protein product [Bemisia tabaci]